MCIPSPDVLVVHTSFRVLFETFCVTAIRFHRVFDNAQLYLLRTHAGTEIDLITQKDNLLFLIDRIQSKDQSKAKRCKGYFPIYERLSTFKKYKKGLSFRADLKSFLFRITLLVFPGIVILKTLSIRRGVGFSCKNKIFTYHEKVF